jgi:hypothetical protein
VISSRKLLREEIEQVWNIDRSEMIDNIYRFEKGTDPIISMSPAGHLAKLRNPRRSSLTASTGADGSMARSRAQNWSESSSWRTSLSASKKMNSSSSSFT